MKRESAVRPEVPAPLLRILFDGGCKVCAWEVGKYLAHDTHGRLGVIDIDAADFDAGAFGLDPIEVRRSFHVMTAKGQVISGVDAFIEIWKTLGTSKSLFASRLASFRSVHLLLELGYRGFVEIRPYLPRNDKNRPSCLGLP